jgi:hypothetical protein
MPSVTDAGTLYDAGTAALVDGRLGPAVLFLRAGERLEPRAGDIARNLGIAEARVAIARGEAGDAPARGPSMPLSAAEAWWVAALLLALGAAGMARRAFRETAREPAKPRGVARVVVGRALDAAGLIGIAAVVALSLLAGMERAMPEAVAIDSNVRLTAASGQPLPGEPALVAGERVRLGREREGLVEVSLEGTTVGWARRSAFWRVRDAARYTPGFTGPRGSMSGSEGNAHE